MNEAAMNGVERVAYLAPWSEIARSIARVVALTLQRAKGALQAARQKADTILNVAAGRVSADRAQMAVERAKLANQHDLLGRERLILDRDKTQARQFIDLGAGRG